VLRRGEGVQTALRSGSGFNRSQSPPAPRQTCAGASARGGGGGGGGMSQNSASSHRAMQPVPKSQTELSARCQVSQAALRSVYILIRAQGRGHPCTLHLHEGRCVLLKGGELVIMPGNGHNPNPMRAVPQPSRDSKGHRQPSNTSISPPPSRSHLM
jgi:hypothetical protein